MRFVDRHDAGRMLAEHVVGRSLDSPIAFGVARGGVVLAAEVAKACNCPLEVLLPRKIPSPYSPEVAIGAVAEDGSRLLDEAALAYYGVQEDYLERTVRRVMSEIDRRGRLYRTGRPPVSAKQATALLLDDGIATGYTLAAAVKQLRAQDPVAIILLVPVASRDGLARASDGVDEVICLTQPEPFFAVSQAYADFDQVSDETVQAILAQHRARGDRPGPMR